MSINWQLILCNIGAIAFGVAIVMFGLLLSAGSNLSNKDNRKHRDDDYNDE